MNINIALKEWDMLITALLEGRQVILLRKGGILDSGNQFELEHNRFLLYPTFIHQDPRMVKAQYRANMRQTAAEPDLLTIRGIGEVARIFEVPSRARLEALDDLHIWDAPLLDMRFNYRPEKPLYLVVVLAFSLPQPVTIQNTLAYAGCKSWVPLAEGIDTSGAVPALPAERVDALITRIQTTFETR